MNSNSHPGITILMPVYNGSRYLKKTLDSILNQTFADYEVLCINDCSTDDSLAILEAYQAKDSRFRVFSTEANLGIVPKIINFASPHVRGEYFFYTSQDDIFSPDLLQRMFERAQSTGADATIPDLVFYHEHEPHKNATMSAPGGDKSRILTNREAVLLSAEWSIPGNALYAVKLQKTVQRCYDFGMNADEYTTRVLFFNCNKVVFSEGTFYYRQDNPDAITKKLSAKMFDYPYTDFKLFEFLREHEFPRDAQELVLSRSIDTLVDLGNLLSFDKMKRSVKQLTGRQSEGSFDARDAAGRVRRCFDALHSGNAPARLRELGSPRAARMTILLANYQWFRAMALVRVGVRLVRSRVRAALSPAED